MSVQDILNNAILDGGQAPTNAASATGDHGQMLLWAMAELAKISGSTDISPTADANGSIAERLAYLQDLTPLSAGIVRNMRDWAGGAGYEFWFGNLADDLSSVASASNPAGVDGWGWTTPTSTTETQGGDLFSEVDPGFNSWQPSSGGTWRSPQIFGGADGYRMAQIFLRQAPTKLVCEFYGYFTSNPTGNTVATIAGGLVSGAPSSADGAGSAGVIVSDGTNFRLVSDNGNDAGAAIDNALHLWRIEYGLVTTEWFMDDVSQGTITTETDVWPTGYYSRAQAGETAFRSLFGRIYYAV